MAVKPFSKEELNFFKFSSIVLDEFPKAVRQMFITLWDSKIAVQPGYQVWDDSVAVRNMLLKSEGGKTTIPINQSIEEWDCTALFQATIYAKTFGFSSGKKAIKTLNDLYLRGKKPAAVHFHGSVNSPTGDQDETYALAIDQIRLLRNTLCHSAKSEISKADFDQYVQLARDALTAAKASTASIDAIGGLTEDDFPTAKVNKLNESFQKELQEMNQFLQGDMMEMKDMLCKMHELMQPSEPTDSLPKSQVPPLVSNFTGRETECEEIISLFTSKSKRLVNIWGSPGFGKTSTAIAVAHHLQSLGHLVFYITFRGKSSKDEFISKLLSHFHSFSKSSTSVSLTPADKLLSIFREIPYSFFLILDNLDGLLSCKSDESATTSVKNEVVNLIREILVSCPNVTLATTTRESLQFMDLEVEGCERFKIGPLDQPSSNNLILKLLPSHNTATATEDVIFNITKISGNVPLAIKLVCSFIHENAETPKECLDDLVNCSENLLEVLDNPDYPNDLRLKKLFDSSFERLSQDEKEAFISLSVFFGSDFSVDAAVAVINGNKTLAKRTLNILARKSLIERGSDSKMFCLHPLLQSFAVEKGENELTEVAISAKIRFYNHYLCLFENLNEQFLTGKSLAACIRFFQERQNICLSFYESLSHEGLCEKVFQALAKSELFLFTLYIAEIDSVSSLYNFAIKKSEEKNNDLAYCKLVVSMCFQKTLYTGDVFSYLSEVKQIRSRIGLTHGDIVAKCLCYEGIRAVSNGMIQSGVELMEEGISNLTKNSDQQILKFLTLQLLAISYNFLKNFQKSKHVSQMAFDQGKEIGDLRRFLTGEYGNNTETNEAEKALRNLASENLPLILGHVCVLSIWARKFLSDKTKSGWCNIVCKLQSKLAVAEKSSGNASSLFQIGDLALVFLGTDHETIQGIKNSIEIAKKSQDILGKTEQQKELEERLAQCYFRKGWCHETKDENSLALESFQQALDIRLELYGKQHPATADTYHQVAKAQTNMGNYSSALKSDRRALEINKKLFGEEHETTAESYSQIGSAQNNMGDCASALESFRRALDIRLNLHGEVHGATANSYSHIGGAQNNMGDYISALESHRRALDVRLKLYGEQRGATAKSFSDIGSAQNNMRDCVSALESFLRALNIRLNLHGEQHPTTADSYSDVGLAQNNMGDCASGLESFRRALEIRLNLHGEQHGATAVSYSDIGRAQNNMGDCASALESHRRALDIRLKLHGEQHATTADSYSDIGIAQNNMGDYTSSLESHQRALDVRLKLHRENHSSTADSYYQIGCAKENLGDLATALKSYQRTLEIRLKLHGEQHSTVADVYYRTGVIQSKMREYSVGRETLQRSLDIRLKLYGEQHESTAECYFQIAVAQFNMGDHSSAFQSSQRALQIGLKLRGEQDSITADIYEQIGTMQYKIGEYTSALKSYALTLSIRSTLFGEIHESTAKSHSVIGDVQNKMGDSTSALKSFCSALDVRLKLHGEEHSTTANSYYSIGVVQYNTGDYAAAVLSQHRALDIMLKLGMEQQTEAANCYYLIGMTETKLRDHEPALASHQRALDIRLKLHGEQHETTADSYFQMGNTQFNMADYSSAVESHQRGLVIRLKLHGEHHSTTLDSYIQIGIMQNKLNDYAAALESNNKALKLSWKLNGKLHATTADCYRYKAINLQKMEKRDLALQDFNRERYIRSKISK